MPTKKSSKFASKKTVANKASNRPSPSLRQLQKISAQNEKIIALLEAQNSLNNVVAARFGIKAD
jgi:hypothetical protein